MPRPPIISIKKKIAKDRKEVEDRLILIENLSAQVRDIIKHSKILGEEEV